jgi:PmbA protein
VAVHDKDQLLNIAEKAVSVALTKGAAEAEAYVYDAEATSVAIERDQIAKSSKIIDRGLGIRIAVNRAIGFAYTNVMERKTVLEETVLRAISAAKTSKPDPNWHGFAVRRPFAQVEGTADPRIKELRSEELVGIASTMLEAAVKSDRRVLAFEGGVGAAWQSDAIANSNGISVSEDGTMIECSLATVAKDGNTVTPVCFEFNSERSFEIDANWVGKEAARLATSALKTKRIETSNTRLILTPFALQELLHYTLINAVKADSVQRDQSPFKDKIGEAVASDNITINDDGLLGGGLRTSVFDGEGCPRQKTTLVEKGILRNYLYDNYSAKREGKDSTGNASRAGYLSTPIIEPTNFRIMPGEISPEKLMEEMDEGLIIYYLQGAHSSNPVSGEFSVVATPAWKIKKGEIVHCSRGIMLAGNIFDVLKNVRIVANNERKIGQIVTPWLLVENIRVIGK